MAALGLDAGRPIREFGWNKLIKPGEKKKLSWYHADLDFQHGGGGAFVLTSVLFQDGSVWEEANDRGLVTKVPLNGSLYVRITSSGRALLDARKSPSLLER